MMKLGIAKDGCTLLLDGVGVSSMFREFEHEHLIKSVMPPRHKNDPIWHYTKFSSVSGIITEGALWASEVSSLNDKTELSHGLKIVNAEWNKSKDNCGCPSLIRKWLDSAESALTISTPSDSFIACASIDGNSQSQFEKYGAYAIGFDPMMPLTKQPLSTSTGGAPEITPAFHVGWRPVIYLDDRKRIHVKKLFVALSSLTKLCECNQGSASCDICRTARECIIRSIAYMKDKRWKLEKEVRLYARANQTGANVFSRPSKEKKIRYLHIISNPDSSGVSSHFPISKIRLGPGLEKPGETDLKSALGTNGYSDVEIDRYRG